MTEKEKNEIVSALAEEIAKKYEVKHKNEDTHTVLKEPREKWFRDENGLGYRSKMTEVFDSSIIAWQVWENVRRLTCMICGKRYVRQLSEEDNAPEVAEKLCQCIYELRKEYMEEKKDGKEI